MVDTNKKIGVWSSYYDQFDALVVESEDGKGYEDLTVQKLADLLSLALELADRKRHGDAM